MSSAGRLSLHLDQHDVVVLRLTRVKESLYDLKNQHLTQDDLLSLKEILEQSLTWTTASLYPNSRATSHPPSPIQCYSVSSIAVATIPPSKTVNGQTEPDGEPNKRYGKSIETWPNLTFHGSNRNIYFRFPESFLKDKLADIKGVNCKKLENVQYKFELVDGEILDVIV